MLVVGAGFVGFEITWRADVYRGAPQSSSAAKYGTLGINFRARKATSQEEWSEALSALTCDVPSPDDSSTGRSAQNADNIERPRAQRTRGRHGHDRTTEG
jgi:hypothetical protein